MPEPEVISKEITYFYLALKKYVWFIDLQSFNLKRQ